MVLPEHGITPNYRHTTILTGYEYVFHDYGEDMQACAQSSVLSGCQGDAYGAPCSLAMCRSLCSADDDCNFITYIAGDGPNAGMCSSARECDSPNDVYSRSGDIYRTYSKGRACPRNCLLLLLLCYLPSYSLPIIAKQQCVLLVFFYYQPYYEYYYEYHNEYYYC
jgi:hypothetical protein